MKIPQKHVGQVLRGFKKGGYDKPLDVEFIMLGDATSKYRGKLDYEKIAGEATPDTDAAQGQEPEPVVLALLRFARTLLVAALSPGSMANYFIAAGTDRVQSPPPVVAGELVDQRIRDVMPVDGNVVAHFSVAPTGDPRDATLAAMVMYRANYTLWPRRMYVSGADTVINSADQLLAARAPADADWLARHDVRRRVDFRFDRGAIQIRRDDDGTSPR